MTRKRKEMAETSIKVILFSGAKKDWSAWEEKFLSRATRRGYRDILLGDPDDIPEHGVGF